MISPTSRPVARRMEPKKREKNRRRRVTNSRMRRHAPFEPIDPNICLWGGIHDVVNCAKLFENRPEGFGASRPRNLAFPIDFAGRPYNTHTTVWGVMTNRKLHTHFRLAAKSITLDDLERSFCTLFQNTCIFGAHHENLLSANFKPRRTAATSGGFPATAPLSYVLILGWSHDELSEVGCVSLKF